MRSGQHVKQLGRVVDDGVGAVFVEFGFVAQAPGDADGEHPGGFGGGHVFAGVADVDEVFRLDAHALTYLECGGGVGLEGDAVALAEHLLEVPAFQEVIDHLGGRLVGLVAEDGESVSALGQGVEHFGDARERFGVVVLVVVVVGQELFDRCLHDLLIGPAGPPQQHLDTVADHLSAGRGGDRFAPHGFKDVVGGEGEVFEGVQERAVEVEHQGVVWHGGECSGWAVGGGGAGPGIARAGVSAYL